MQVVAFEPETPGAGFRRRAEHREREPLRRALARHVALRRQHVLQRHHVAGLLDAGRREQRREHVPGGRFLRRAHLLEPQSRLDVVAACRNSPSCAIAARSRQRSRPCACRVRDRREICASRREDRRRARARPAHGRAWAACAAPTSAEPRHHADGGRVPPRSCRRHLWLHACAIDPRSMPPVPELRPLLGSDAQSCAVGENVLQLSTVPCLKPV